ncbi:MAG: hypothetical protein FWH02_07640 [Oscillospiraceae bacterium]|nr:hypothetical protein [Oscillospiraceae bacterium]
MKKFISISMVIVLLVSMSVTAMASTANEAGKNPGLGVRALHKSGITGKGVSVAFIGLGIRNDNLKNFTHPEFDGRIKEYVNIGWDAKSNIPSIYAKVSAIVGKTVGTAPGANLYMIGMNVDQTPGYKAKRAEWPSIVGGIEWVLEKNKSLSKEDKIRVIVVDSFGRFDTKEDLTVGAKVYYQTLEKAEKEGVVVIGTRGPGWGVNALLTVLVENGYYDSNSPDDVNMAKVGIPGNNNYYRNERLIHAPSVRRTLAWTNKSYKNINSNDKEGWWVNDTSSSYVAGVIAMAYQVNPNISNTRLVKLLNDTATNNIVNPPAFIEAVKRTVK